MAGTLTAGIDNVPGTAGNDTIEGNATTFSSLDAINGGAGTDTLSIVDTAGSLSAAPTGVKLTSVERMTISTTGDLGISASGVAAVAQVDQITLPTVTANVQQSNQYVFSTGTDSGAIQFTYGGAAGSFSTVHGTAADTATNFAAAVNSVAGKTVAYTGSTATAGAGTATTSTTATVTSTSSLVAGMSVTVATAGALASGTYIKSILSATTFELSAAPTTALTTSSVFTFGGGTAGVTVLAPTAGTASPSIAFTLQDSTDVAYPSQKLIVANTDGNVGDVVSFTYAGQSGQYTIGSSNDATATALANALNAVASTATAAVAGSTGSKYVTLTADTAGTALGQLVFVNAGSNTPTVTTSTNNRVATAVNAAAYDVSDMAADTVTVTMADSANLKVAATSDVNVSGVTGGIIVDGGKNVIVTDASAASDITIGATTVPKGTVTVTATKAGASSVAVDGGTDVTVNVTGSSGGADDITVGNGGATTDLPTGAVVVTSTHTGVAATNVALNGITVKGGTTVTVTQNADTSKVADDTTGQTLTQGAVAVTGGAATTSIEINQAAAATANAAVKAVAAKAATTKVTFTGLAANEYITLTGDTNKSITFTAAKALTAAEVAAAFANLVSGATVGSAPASNGVYTNGSSGSIAAGFTTGAVVSESATSAYVVFSTTTDASSGTAGIQAQAITGTSSGSNARVSVATSVDGNAATLAETGKLGVVVGAVTVNGAITGTDVLKTVTLNGYGTATVASDALTTLNLSNADASLTATTASTGSVTLNLNKVAGSSAAVSLDGGSAATVTGVTINANGTKSDLTVTANAATAVTINAAVDLDLTDSSFDAAKTITVTGAGKVTIDEAGTSTALTVLEKIDASGSTGGVTVKDTMGAADQFIGGSGVDTFALASSATKASSGGAGNDVITVASFGTGGSVDAGDGTDTLVMAADDAITASASAGAGVLFMSKATNFEKLSVLQYSADNATASTADEGTVDLSSLRYNYVISAGTTTGGDDTAQDKLLLTNAGNGVTLEIAANGLFNVGVLDASTGTADVVNIVTNLDGDTTLGTVTAADVETINITADDKVVDTSGAYDEFGAAIADGKDDTNSAQGLVLAVDKATKVNVSGSADLTLDLSSSTLVTAVDASAMTGKFILVADGKSTGTTVTGGAGADELEAYGSGDVLIGGAGNDKLTADTLTSMTGGAGNDTFVMKSAVASTAYSTITDLSAGDVISFNNGVSGFNTTKISLAATASFADYLASAVGANSVTGNTAEKVEWFQFNGNTYIVVDGYGSSDGSGYTAGEDSIIEIVGLIDLSKAVFNSTADTLTIV